MNLDAPPWLVAWLDAVSLWDLILIVAAVVAAVLFIYKKGWRTVVALARGIIQSAAILVSVQGLPSFIERSDNRHEELAKKVDGIYHELHPNGGTSMNDGLKRVENTTERLELGVRGLYDRVAELTDSDEQLRAADAKLRADLESTLNPEPLEATTTRRSLRAAREQQTITENDIPN
ncbi:hypothetical protein GCM10009775_04770 [Microbacterium aoyamense]|uniref:Uncharacterized protein n=1 Tax=Microbacterium aoyamense TaxID=344166 RepID=A0ABN2PB96_9MICO|nr:hypothetical protein [Microbacterium aoyamense]